MITEIENARQHISMAIVDILQDRAHSINIKEAKQLIINHVFEDINKEPDSTYRYEWYYQLMGKSVAIAQGWKLNCIKELKDQSETSDSLNKYIEGTYGKKIE